MGGFSFVDTAVGAAATLLIAATGWLTMRNARKAQVESHIVTTHEQKRRDSEWIVDASRELAETIQKDLERIRDELATERQLREAAQAQADRLQEELARAESKVGTLMVRLDEAREESERLRREMDALRAEMRAYRGETRTSDSRSRWDDPTV